MRRFSLFVLAPMLLVPFVVAQSTNRVEVFGGYSYLSSDFTQSTSGGVSGWNVSAAVRVFRYVGVVADFSGFSPSTASACPLCGGLSGTYRTYMGGPQISAGFGRFKPFARVMFGATKGNSTHSNQYLGDFSPFTFAVGGGVDVGLNRWLAVRGQIDLVHIGSYSSDAARLSTGLVARF